MVNMGTATSNWLLSFSPSAKQRRIKLVEPPLRRRPPWHDRVKTTRLPVSSIRRQDTLTPGQQILKAVHTAVNQGGKRWYEDIIELKTESALGPNISWGERLKPSAIISLGVKTAGEQCQGLMNRTFKRGETTAEDYAKVANFLARRAR